MAAVDGTHPRDDRCHEGGEGDFRSEERVMGPH